MDNVYSFTHHLNNLFNISLKMVDCVYYNRVSTDNRDQDPKSNYHKTKDYINSQEYNYLGEYVDNGVSGNTYYYEREKGKELYGLVQEYIKKNKELVICVFSIDRFTRQEPTLAKYLLYTLKNKGVRVESATEVIFSEDSEFTEPMQFMVLWFNYYFLQQHSKKVKAGMEKRKLEGKNIGRGIIKEVIGSGQNKKTIFYSPEELDIIHESIIMLNNKGMSYREIKTYLSSKKNINVSISYIGKVIKEK